MKKKFFLKHAWLSFRRSPALTQNVLQTIVMAFFGFYIAVSFLVVGVVSGELIRDFFPERDAIGMMGAFLMFYLLIDILIRYFLQKFPTLSVKPYLLLPVPKKRMVHYLLRRSLLSFYNFLLLFIAIPFLLIEVVPQGNTIQTIGFALLVLGIILSSNYISFWASKASDFNNALPIVFLAVLLGLLYLEFNGYISFFPYLEEAALAFFSNPIWWVIPVAVVAGMYLYLFNYFKSFLKVENQRDSEGLVQSLNLGYFGRFGKAGQLMDLELRLIIRSKRARSYLLLSILVLLFPLSTVLGEKETLDFNYILYGLLMTGMIALNHGQLMLSWNSMHFDLLLSRGNTIKDIFKAKYYVLVLSCLVTYVLTLPYLFLDPVIVLFSTALLFINTSFSIYAYMFLASFNSLRIDPNEGGSFSFSGFGAAHYLIGLPIVFVPVLLYYAGYAFGGMNAGVGVLFIIGLVGTLLHRYVIDGCVKLFMSNRYKIAAAFRKE